MSLGPKPGEFRGILILEKLEKMFRRPETRMDAQRILSKVSAQAQAYAKQLVVSGPTNDGATAKECGLTIVQLEAAMSELEAVLFKTKEPK